MPPGHLSASRIALAQAKPYDLILMDVQRPELDGLEATRSLRATTAWAVRPILAMTASFFEEQRERCRSAGMNGFVLKPVVPEQLCATLLEWLPALSSGEVLPSDVDAGLRSVLGRCARCGGCSNATIPARKTPIARSMRAFAPSPRCSPRRSRSPSSATRSTTRW